MKKIYRVEYRPVVVGTDNETWEMQIDYQDEKENAFTQCIDFNLDENGDLSITSFPGDRELSKELMQQITDMI